MISSVLLAYAAALAGPVDAVPPPAEATTAAATKEKKVCRDDPASTGSIMPKRTCKTKAEWEALARTPTRSGSFGDQQRTVSQMRPGAN
ncbi:MAG TPA: hypothetical protein VF750_08310 [Sphingomicrobium sp.]